MNKNQLIESLSLRRSTMFLLGAGCSISSGCKSANLIVKDFKLRLYCDKHKIPYEKTTDYYEKELDKEINEYPTPHGENPYSYYFEKCFPLPKDRNEYIRAEFQNKNPSLGYLCFANYLLQQQIHDVATTNFDRLVERAIRRLDPNADIVSESERSNPIGDHQISILSLHGDYNYDLVRNTESELQSLSKNVAEKFSEKHISRLIILGYSGQDKSVIDAIKTMENRCQNTEVIWCFFEVDPEIPTSIQQVLSYPQACAAFGINFDNLFIDYCRIKSPKNPVIDELIHREKNSYMMFDERLVQKEELISNAFRILHYPSVYQSSSSLGLDDDSVPFKDSYYGFSPTERSVTIAWKDLKLPVSQKTSFLNKMIQKGAHSLGLKSYKNLIFKQDIVDTLVPALRYQVSPKNNVLLFEPTYTYGREPTTMDEKAKMRQEISRLRADGNYRMLMQLINDFFGERSEFSFAGNRLSFEQEPLPVGSKSVTFQYSVIQEPRMSVNGFESVNQLALTYRYGPDKIPLSPEEITVAVLCPQEKKNRFYRDFLQPFKKGIQSPDKYIYKRFPGFEKYSHKRIRITGIKDLPFSLKNLPASQEELLNQMLRWVKLTYDQKNPDVVVIFFAKEMGKYRCGSFDFHDALKAKLLNSYKTQIVEEGTLDSSDEKNKIYLNFALALYTKTIGMPWTPAKFERDKFFLGMTFGANKAGMNISCSQLFDGAGRGLMLLTAPVSDKRDKNPYLSQAEAYRLGQMIRNQYYKASKPDPLKKIVIHRTVPFKREEIEGFNMAFEGLDDFTLLQIVQYPLENVYVKNGTDVSGYPALRGTVIQISPNEILLWTTGSMRDPDILGGKTYRNSGWGMDHPILVRKFHGEESIEEIAGDILRLTKMDFNSGDSLFSRLPVTLKYATTLAQILKNDSNIKPNDLVDFRYVM